MTTRELQRFKVLTAGILSLILLVGIARFSYTSMLALMQQAEVLGIAESGWLATINYLGYFLGAIIASLSSDLVLKDRLYRIGLIVAIITTVGMGLTDNFYLWAVLRFFAGLSAAAGILLSTGLIMNWLIRHDHHSELGIHFAGIGLGIAICALLIQVLQPWLNWREQWYLLTLLGLILIFPAWRWLPPPDRSTLTQAGNAMQDNPPRRIFMMLFMACYFCAGAGYVVGVTFIVAFVDLIPQYQGMGSWVYMVLGLAAAPGCILWDYFARWQGIINAVIVAFAVQIAGILMPLFEPNMFNLMLGAALFGFSFIGIVSLVLTLAGSYYPTRPAKMMGKVTLTYGIAQIITPAITGVLAEHSGRYDAGFYLSAALMLLGMGLLIVAKRVEH